MMSTHDTRFEHDLVMGNREVIQTDPTKTTRSLPKIQVRVNQKIKTRIRI